MGVELFSFGGLKQIICFPIWYLDDNAIILDSANTRGRPSTTLVCVFVSLTERGLLLAAYTRSLCESGMFWGSRYLNTVCEHARLVLPKVNQERFPAAMMRP